MCRLAVYALFLLLRSSFFGCLTFARAGEVNITVDDTDPSIVYQPDTAWFFNGNSSRCTFCLTPPSPTIASNSTWHHGLHVIPTQDMDDLSKSSVDGDSDGDAPAMRPRRSEGDLVVGRRTYDPTNGATTSPFVANKLDADDASFVDFPVSVQFNFTGSAIYLFCVLPLGVPPNTNSTPTLMDLTFTLDGEPAGSFFHNGSTNTGGFQSNIPVLSRGNLSDSAHNLLVNLGPNSVFLLDYYVFSRSDGSNIGSPSTPATGTVSESTAIPKKKHEVQTFAGAVGGSVGVLAVVSACVAISIFRRRRRSTRQHLQDRERQSDAQSFHTDASDDPPSMQGLAPFIPRYFPGTLPPAPPPYIGPTRMDGPTPLSYHVPPPIPSAHRAPPVAALDAAHDTEPLDIPPPFSVAVSSPEPPVLVNAMRHTIPRIPPPRLVEDGQPALPEAVHLPPTETAVLLPRSPPRSQLTRLPVSHSTFSLTPSATGSETETHLSRAPSDHDVALDT
ncbi:hypothetical protein BJY52DRAFT_1185291 [Lactarius psammicola]|nr:hypothetical protein BJY52DRAFT_1185291 [Lactarius psammicola]